MDPGNPSTVYAGTAGGGVWRSDNSGADWSSTGWSLGLVAALAVDPSGAIYAGTGTAGVQVSRDGAATWQDLDPALRDGCNCQNGFSLSVDPSDSQRVFLGTIDGGLQMTRDGGATWAVAGQGYGSRTATRVVFDPKDPQVIYAGSFQGGGVFKSTDGGLTWNRRRFGSATVYVAGTTLDPGNSSVVYAQAATAPDGLFKSADSGDSWTRIGEKTLPPVQSLAIDPFNSKLMVAASLSGIFRSTDGGDNWVSVSREPAWNITLDPKATATVYAGTQAGGILRSLDGGVTWQPLSNGLTNLNIGRNAGVIIDPTNSQVLYVGTLRGGVFKSRDGGEHWYAVNSGLNDMEVFALAIDPANPSVLYAVGRNGNGVNKTSTGGE